MSSNIFIAIPSYPRRIDASTNTSLIALGGYLHENRIRYRGHSISRPDIAMVRNMFGTMVLNDKTLSHILFVDNDMMFEPKLIGRMLAAKKPIIGVIYPKKTLDLNRFYEEAKTKSLKKALALASDFVLWKGTDNSRQLNFKDGMGAVPGLGAGLMLVERSVFEKMSTTGKLAIRNVPDAVQLGLKGPVHGFFDEMRTGNQDLSEDNAFCHRCSELCGLEVWGIADAKVGHVGDFTFSARLADQFI